MAKLLFLSNLWYESMGLMQLSAVAKRAGHKVDLCMVSNNSNRLLRYVTEVNPDIIGFSIMTGQRHWALRTAAFLKQRLNPSPLIIFGGPHPTFAPEIIEENGVDIICRGEGEGALLDLLSAIGSMCDFSNIPNLWVKKDVSIIKNEVRPLISDLDSLPLPDREIFYQYSYFRDNPIRMVMTSRGCPFNCSFCFNESYRSLYNIASDYIRRRTCRHVIEEIKLIRPKYRKTHYIRFHDDIFTSNRQWLYEFLDIYKSEIKLPFVCFVRAGVDEESIKRLARAGCVRIGFGVETGNQALRNNILKKLISDEQIYDLARNLKKYDIPFFTNTMFFLPGENIDNVWETIRMNQIIKPNYVANYIFQSYPGTTISANLVSANFAQTDYLKVPTYRYVLPFPKIQNSNEINMKINLYYFYVILVKFPFLERIVIPLIKLRPNILFLIIFKITEGFNHCLRNKISFFRFLREACRSINFK